MAMCPKCATNNDDTRLTCFRCGMVLPNLSLESLNTKSEVNVIIDDNLESKDVVKASDCIFLTAIKDIKTKFETSGWDAEEMQGKIASIKQETNYILDLINSFSDEEKSWMTTGLEKIDTSYDLFHEAIAKLEQYLSDQNQTLLDELMKTAAEASHMLLEGINQAQDELGVEEDKLSEQLQGDESDEELDMSDLSFDEETEETTEEDESEKFR